MTSAVSKKPWDKLLDQLDPTRPIDPHFLTGHGKRVLLARFWEQKYGQAGAAVWLKEYRQAEQDLREFNKAERNMLEQLKHLELCYQLVSQSSQSSKLRTSTETGEVFSGDFIGTTHMGPTLADWAQWPVRVGKQRQPYRNLFQLPGNFLQLALAGLKALHTIHEKNFVHADFRLPNACLDATIQRRFHENGADALEVRIDWSALKLIDFGYSIHRHRTPTTLLPLSDVTRRTMAIFEAIERKGMAAFNPLLKNGEAAKRHWARFDDARYNATFWSHFGGTALDQLREIDWREDYWQFGKQLAEIRRGSGRCISRPDGCEWLDDDHPGPLHAEQRGALDRDVEWAIDCLPEELMAWGEQELPETHPYAHYVQRLEKALKRLGGSCSTESVVLLRPDFEPPPPPHPEDRRHWLLIALAGLAIGSGGYWLGYTPASPVASSDPIPDQRVADKLPTAPDPQTQLARAVALASGNGVAQDRGKAFQLYWDLGKMAEAGGLLQAAIRERDRRAAVAMVPYLEPKAASDGNVAYYLGQLQACALGNGKAARKAYGVVSRNHPLYENAKGALELGPLCSLDSQ